MRKKHPTSYHRIGVMIGSPSDADDERQALTDAILRWNASYKDQGVLLEPVKWETHATPGLEGRPQGMINEELIPQSDCLLAVFRARAGSPTGKEISGTIEEIREFMRLGKYVAIYFYEGPVSLGSVDADQLKSIRQFKKEIQQNGLIENYSSIDELRAKVLSQLYAIVNKIALRPSSSRSAGTPRKSSASPRPSEAAISRTPRKAQPAIQPIRTTNMKVDSSDDWALIGGSFLATKSFRKNRDGTMTLEVPSRSAEIDASMTALQPHHFGRSKPIPFAHGNDAWLVTVRDVESVSQANEQLWTITLVPEQVQYGGDAMEMAVRTASRHYTADDIAKLRAGRLLLNDPPPLDERGVRWSDQTGLDAALLETNIRGTNTPASVKDCIIQTVYSEHRGEDIEFLKLARLGAIFMLKAGNVVEHVRKLTLGPIRRGKVHVEFVGVRRKRYDNVEPKVIELEGDCPLE